MRHEVSTEGFAFRLRPVRSEDAPIIVDLRTSDPDRTRYLHPISRDIRQQEQWLLTYFSRVNDYYWVVERRANSQVEGLIGIYDVDVDKRAGEWGRWVLRPGSLAAVESALLVYQTGFESLGLLSLYCVTVDDNSAVVSFHDSCGLPRAELLREHFALGERKCDGIKHICGAATWPTVRAFLEPRAQRIASRLTKS